MDDFTMILGIEFFDRVYAFPLPTINSLSIFDGIKGCVIPVKRAQPEKKTLSVMQRTRGFKNDPSHMVSIRNTTRERIL